MREELAKLGINYVGNFVGTIQKIKGCVNTWHQLKPKRKINYYTTNLCLENVTQLGSPKILAQHLWVQTKVPYRSRHQFTRGEQLKFKGTVYQYTRNYYGAKPWLNHPSSLDDYTLSFDEKLSN